MRLKLNPPGKTHRLFTLVLILLVTGLFAVPLFAQSPTAGASEVSSNRFLFIVETSSAMKRHQADTLKVVNDIITNAATGQMHPGDSLGLWTFNQDVFSGLPVQTWTGGNREQVAQITVNFLKKQRYGKAGRLEKALADLWPVIKDSDIITIFIISTGHGKMTGTPLDNEINTMYQQALADMKKPRPVVTVLQARGGKLVRCTVTAVPWPVVIPEIPIPIRRAAPPQIAETPAQPATNAPPPVAKAPVPNLILSKPKVSLPPPPSPTTSAIPESKPLPALPPVVPTPPATATNPVTPPPIAPTVPPQATVIPPLPVATQSVPPPGSTPVPPPPSGAVPPPIATSAPSNVPPTPTAPPPTLAQLEAAVRKPSHPLPPKVMTNPPAIVQPTVPTPTNEITSPPSTNEPVAQPATNSVSSQALGFVAPTAPTRSKTLLFAGLALLGIGILLIILLLRRSRAATGSSLISETMRKDKQE